VRESAGAAFHVARATTALADGGESGRLACAAAGAAPALRLLAASQCVKEDEDAAQAVTAALDVLGGKNVVAAAVPADEAPEEKPEEEEEAKELITAAAAAAELARANEDGGAPVEVPRVLALLRAHASERAVAIAAAKALANASGSKFRILRRERTAMTRSLPDTAPAALSAQALWASSCVWSGACRRRSWRSRASRPV
jgi:hypothetical protein